MSPRLNGKFVSREKYEAATAAEKVVVVSDTETAKKTRTVDPITAATASVRKAKRELDRVTAAWAKRKELPSLDEAQHAYDDAVSVLQAALNV